MGSICDECGTYSGSVSKVNGDVLCSSCERCVSLSEMSEEEIANAYSVGDDVGAFIGIVRDRTVEWTESDGNGGFRDRSVERDAGVYVSSRCVNGGTCVQNSTVLLEEVVGEMIGVVERVQEAGYRVTGFGKNHDASMLVYIDTSDIDARDPFITGDEFVEGTAFSGCTLMSLRRKWHENKESSPRLGLRTEPKKKASV